MNYFLNFAIIVPTVCLAWGFFSCFIIFIVGMIPVVVLGILDT